MALRPLAVGGRDTVALTSGEGLIQACDHSAAAPVLRSGGGSVWYSHRVRAVTFP